MAIKTTVAQRAMGKAFLKLLGAKNNSKMIYAIIAWTLCEGASPKANNPWNYHYGSYCPKDHPSEIKGFAHSQRLPADPAFPGVIGNYYAAPSDQNVAIYATITDGLRTSAENLLSGLTPARSWTGYGPVVLAARRGDPGAFCDALAKSKWAADKYGTKNGGPNRIKQVYSEIVVDLGDWYQL